MDSGQLEQLRTEADLDWQVTRGLQQLYTCSSSTPWQARTECLTNLTLALYTRFQHLGRLEDIENAIKFQDQAVNLCPADDPRLWHAISALAFYLMGKFQRLHHIDDLDQAIEYQRQVLDHWPPGHAMHYGALNNLAAAFQMRFRHLCKTEDISEAIRLHREVLDCSPPDHDRGSFLHNLAGAILERFEEGKDQRDIDEVVQLYRQISELCPPPHAGRYQSLWDLADAIQRQSMGKGNLEAIDELVNLWREALDLLPSFHPARADSIGVLANLVCERGSPADIDEGVQLYREASRLRFKSHEDRGASLINLVTALHRQYKQHGDLDQITEAIEVNREALDLFPPPHPTHNALVNSLAASILVRFQHHGGDDDINEAVQLFEQATKEYSSCDSGRADSIIHLATALYLRSQKEGAPADIEKGILLCREALELYPESHPGRPSTLSTLATSLQAQVMQGRNPEDADEVIRLYREALMLYPKQDPGREETLSHLASSLRERFSIRGNAEDIDKAVRLHRQALALLPLPNLSRATSLNNLANSLRERFECHGEANDINEAIAFLREASVLHPSPHPHQGLFLSNLASALRERIHETGNTADIDESVELHRNALVLCSHPHIWHRNALNNLAAAVFERYRYKGITKDIDEAVLLHQKVLDLCPSSQPERPLFLNNLANCIVQQGIHDGKNGGGSFDRAIRLFRDSLDIAPHPHPLRGRTLHNLGNCLVKFHTIAPNAGHLDNAVLTFRESSEDISSPTLARFRAAKTWAETADQYGHSSVLDAYKIAIDILPRLAGLGLDLKSRQQMLTHAYGLSCDAAACAIGLKQYSLAIELLEAGRSIFWSQTLNLRTPLDNLRNRYPDLAIKLSEILWQLEKGAFRDSSRNPSTETYDQVLSVEAENTRCRNLNEERLQTLDSIRALPGFEDFMRNKTIAELRAAAGKGSIVILNAGKSSCHALILNFSNEIQCVPLPDTLKWDQVNSLASSMRALSAGSVPGYDPILATFQAGRRDSVLGPRLIGKVEKGHSPNERFCALLGILWDLVALPVLRATKSEKSANPPRLWWCPTGPFAFLPIHAAGIYDGEKRESVSDYVVSSYTPTLSTLLSSPLPLLTAENPLKVMAVIQPTTPGHPPLPYTAEELRRIKRTVPKEWLNALGTLEAPASVGEVLLQLPTSSILHFACHGTQDRARPLESALLIGSGRLKVSQIMETLPQGRDSEAATGTGLVVLSACETAMGADQMPDEAMHLAATLLFAGFRSVVATMWTIHDPDGPEIAEAFYTHLFRNANVNADPSVFPDLTESARALHLAVAKLQNEVPFARWVPFVHFGL